MNNPITDSDLRDFYDDRDAGEQTEMIVAHWIRKSHDVYLPALRGAPRDADLKTWMVSGDGGIDMYYLFGDQWVSLQVKRRENWEDDLYPYENVLIDHVFKKDNRQKQPMYYVITNAAVTRALIIRDRSEFPVMNFKCYNHVEDNGGFCDFYTWPRNRCFIHKMTDKFEPAE